MHPADGRVVSNFIVQALKGEPITIFGDGAQQRCFTNVHDVVESLARLAAADAAIGEVVNIGNPREISIQALAHLIRQRTGSDSPVEFHPYETAYGPGFEDMRRRVPDVSRLKQLTGYVPATPIEETIDQIIEASRGRAREPVAAAGVAAHGVDDPARP